MPASPAPERESGPTAIKVMPVLSTRTLYGKSAASSFGPSGSSTSSNGDQPLARARRQPVHERQQRVHLEREPAVRRRHEHAPRDAAELVHEAPLPLAAAGDVLDDGVREAEVELAVGERQLAAVGAHGAHLRERGREPVELGVPDAGDPLRPG